MTNSEMIMLGKGMFLRSLEAVWGLTMDDKRKPRFASGTYIYQVHYLTHPMDSSDILPLSTMNLIKNVCATHSSCVIGLLDGAMCL